MESSWCRKRKWCIMITLCPSNYPGICIIFQTILFQMLVFISKTIEQHFLNFYLSLLPRNRVTVCPSERCFLTLGMLCPGALPHFQPFSNSSKPEKLAVRPNLSLIQLQKWLFCLLWECIQWPRELLQKEPGHGPCDDILFFFYQGHKVKLQIH